MGESTSGQFFERPILRFPTPLCNSLKQRARLFFLLAALLLGPLSPPPLYANPANPANSANSADSVHAMHDRQSEIVTSPSKLSQHLFRFDSPAAVAAWGATDDRVMGGVSQSRMRFDPSGHAVFEGVMSLERNSGFASVRAAVPSPVSSSATAPAMAKQADYVLTVRGDGKRYKLNLRTAGQFDAVSYQASFDTTADVWITVRLLVGSFEPTFRGRRVNAPPLDPNLVREAGLMIADKQAGPFVLHINAIVLAGR